jgi:GTP pyrophosphokinase
MAGGVAIPRTEVKIRIEDILNRMEQYRPDLDEDLLRHAYVFAANRHQGQIRRSGEPYLTHPLTVAWILADMELDEETVAAGLLHDLLEDTPTTAEEIEVEFGPEIDRLVTALTKMADFESSYSKPRTSAACCWRRSTTCA